LRGTVKTGRYLVFAGFLIALTNTKKAHYFF
jgi:hypothetical protein